jgi:uncharacterized membrane protein
VILILRFFHIVAGVFWAGAAMFSARYLLPSLKAAGPAAQPFLAQLNKRRIPMAMMGAALVNIASGIWLMALDSGGGDGAWARSPMGRTLMLGGALAIVAVLLGLAVGMPAGRRMGTIAAAVQQRGGPPAPDEAAELARLQRRSGMAAVSAAVLLFLATAAMAVARYMP